MSHKVKVRVFARARELAGADAVDVELASGASVADLRHQLASDYPPLAGLLARCAIAIDDEFAEDEAIVPAGAEIALLPPVSGGA